MIYELVRSEIAQCELSDFTEWPLHFDICTTRFIKSGSKYNFRCLWRTYKLLRGYPPSPQILQKSPPWVPVEGIHPARGRSSNPNFSAEIQHLAIIN